jgi:peptidyl-prolyl cis-trans isomerase B (cyclophilin B)
VPKPIASSVAKIPAAKEALSKLKPKLPVLQTAEDGLSIAQKLLFVAAIVAVCILFIRSRGAKNSAASVDRFKEKSLA